jgi:RNA-directed DNA polymerase
LTALASLKNASSLSDVAALLGFTPSGLAWVLFKAKDEQKYAKFEIPKKSGGVREICAPLGALKLLQKNLANYLYECRDDIQKQQGRRPLSHGFRVGQSIITNARVHRRQRYVLNLDLQSFFPSFNFGRVRGFFMKDKDFGLNPHVATVIAQIACFENSLPQGSPCSPIIADMIAHILDSRLVRLAKAHHTTYSRYADDLTFSTSEKTFPAALAIQSEEPAANWILGDELVATIAHAGFAINSDKTRMQVRPKRQMVTGLTVNMKVNIPQAYFRYARSMCHSLFSTGAYHHPVGAAEMPILTQQLSPLHGMLSHIQHVKRLAEIAERGDENIKTNPGQKLYARFLFYKFFIALQKPLIICEGKTDRIYLKYAIRHLDAFHPRLGQWDDDAFEAGVSFFVYTNRAHQILDLTGGSGSFQGFVNQYRSRLAKYKHKPLANPVILLMDNDDGLTGKFCASLKKQFNVDVGFSSAEPFYHLTDNLYLIKTVEGPGGGTSCIEDCFEPEVKAIPLEGKMFEPDSGNPEKHFGKAAFAEKVVAPNASKINWQHFAPLLSRIVSAMDHHDAVKAAKVDSAA